MAIRNRLRALLTSLVLGGSGLLLVASNFTAVGCGENKGVTGEKPAPDAEMKSVIINVFGMT